MHNKPDFFAFVVNLQYNTANVITAIERRLQQICSK